MMKRFLTFTKLAIVALFAVASTQGVAQTIVPCGTTIAISDPGGPTANYPNSQNVVTTYCPAGVAAGQCPDVLVPPQGQRVTLNITTFAFETNWDAFYIWNGPTAAAPTPQFVGPAGATIGGFPAGGWTGTGGPIGPFVSTHATGCISTRFRSDASVTLAGYVGTVSAAMANGAPCPVIGAPLPCVLNCSGDINVSLSGCNPFTIPAKITLAWLTGDCPRVLLPISQNFTQAFDYANRVFWLPGNPNNAAYGNLTCTNLTELPNALTLVSADVNGGSNACNWFGTVVAWNVPTDGQISFDWTTQTNDPTWDFFGYSTTNDPNTPTGMFGNVLQASTTQLANVTAAGTATVNVTAGSIFSLVCMTLDGAGGAMTARISNFRYSEFSCPTVVQLAGPLPGDKVGQGIYNMKFEGLDAFGNSLGKCVFKINVTAVQPNLTCNDLLNISVNETCRIALTPDMLLNNFAALAPCTAGSFDIRVWPFGSQANATGNVNGIATAFPLGKHTYEIRHPYGQKCWGEFVVEDKLVPRIDCGPIRNIFCYEVDAFVAQTLANAQFRPTWSDNCGAVTAEFTTHKLLDGCNGGFLKRKWLVTDGSGNTAACDQHFNVITDVNWFCPIPLVELTCKDDTSPEALALSKGIDYAYPYFQNGAVKVAISGVCNYYANYTDSDFPNVCGPHCHGNSKVIRTWQVLDWCTGRISYCTQIIKAVDSEAPTFFLRDTIISTAPWYCEGDFYVPNPWELHDNCDIAPTWTVKSSEVGVTIIILDGQAIAGHGPVHPKYKYRALGVPKGTTHLKYTATDCCGNEVTIVSNVTVVDRTPPIPVVVRDLVIGLTPGYDANGVQDGQAKLYCESINHGSYDNCSAVRCEIRRPAGSPACGNLGNGNPAANNNVTFNNKFPANLANNMPYNSNDTDGGLWVKFCCADLETIKVDANGDGKVDELDKGYNEVIVRVWDDANMDGIVGNLGDNWNETWCYVKVECKVPPVISCPPDATIHCDWAIETYASSSATKSIDGVDFTKTGLPEAYGVCTNPTIGFRDKLTLNQCKLGTIERTFVIVEKGITRTCVQIITILPSNSQQPWVTSLPGDWDNIEPVSCDGPSAEDIARVAPSNVGGPCDVIGTNTHQWQYDFENGLCRKWQVDYSYTNWCTNENRGPFTKYFMYNDVVAPVIECRDTMYAVDANCELRGLMLTKSATDEGGCISNGWIKWTIFVDLWADGVDDYEFTSFLTPGDDVANANSGNIAAIQDNNGNGVKDIYVAPTVNGAQVKITIPEVIGGKMSNHKVAWKVTDGCHNFTTCHEQFMVADKKAPTPVCIPLTTALMADPDGAGPFLPMVELWAIDFMNKASDNCTPSADLLYTFENVGPQIANIKIQGRDVNWDVAHYFNADGGKAAYPARESNAAEKAIRDKYLRGEDGLQLWNPVTRSSAKVWTSTSLTAGETKTNVDVKVTVWDKKLNHDYCWTTIGLICNTCDSTPGSRPVVSGTVNTNSGLAVNNVTVTLNANITEYPVSKYTSTNGTFAFEVKEGDVNNAFTMTASKGGDYINGVSTLDLVLIQRHILGVEKLTDPYKVIAADVNNDGKVTASDLTELRKLILGINNSFTNTSWRFPVSGQTLDATTAFTFVEKYNYASMTDLSSQNFVAVKIGDVNGNVATNVNTPVTEGRSDNHVGLVVEDQALLAGNTVSIPVTAANFNDVFGYQFTMNLNGGSLVEVQAGALDVDASNIGVLSGDVVTMSYASNEGVTVSSNEVLFTMVVRANRATTINEMMTLNSAVTTAESYVGSDLKVGKVSLEVRTAPVASIELFQNEPNPFKGLTTVSFNMPSAAQATISIYNVTGQLVAMRKIPATKGMNSERFTSEQLGASGVLVYKLESGDFTATKKMIIIE